MNQKVQSRRGAVLITVLACLGVVATIVATSVQCALRCRNEVRIHRHMLQTQFLCEAGLLRAKQQLKKAASYSGEIWTTAVSPSSDENARIEIQVEPTPDLSTRSIQVTVQLFESTDRFTSFQSSELFTLRIQEDPLKGTK
jgi:type II secretory pathway component PulK